MNRAHRVASDLFGCMWLFAAATKILAPLTAYEFVARVAPPGLPAKTALVVAIAAETLLGAAMMFRAVGAVRGYALSLVGLAAACGALLQVRAHAKVGEIVQCGCYGDAFSGSLDDELLRNGVMAGVLVLLIAWGLIDRGK